MTPQPKAKRSMTLLATVCTEAGRHDADATFDWLRKRGVSEKLLRDTIEFLNDYDWPVYFGCVPLDILNLVENVARYIGGDGEPGPRLVYTNPNISDGQTAVRR